MLFTAARDGFSLAAALLIEKGADVNKTDQNGQTPLLIASAKGRSDVAKLLLQRKAATDVAVTADVDEFRGKTALILAAKSGHVEVVRLLVAAGADQSLKDGVGKTAMEWAQEGCRANVIEALKAA